MDQLYITIEDVKDILWDLCSVHDSKFKCREERDKCDNYDIVCDGQANDDEGNWEMLQQILKLAKPLPKKGK